MGGDSRGRKRVLVTGVAVRTVAALACAAAPSITVLIVVRVIEGLGAALVFPQVLPIIQVSYQGEARTRALGLFGAIVALGLG